MRINQLKQEQVYALLNSLFRNLKKVLHGLLFYNSLMLLKVMAYYDTKYSFRPLIIPKFVNLKLKLDVY